jgi:ATP-dependent DNA helicase RecQ
MSAPEADIGFTAPAVDTPLTSLVLDGLAEGPATAERLAARLATKAPHVAARGVYWLERELIRSRVARRLPDGRWEALTEEEQDDDDGTRDEPVQPSLLPERPRTVVILDLETNADRADPRDHEIIEIAACRIRDGAIEAEFGRLVLASRPLTHAVTELTGITDDELRRHGVPAAQALQEFVSFAGGDPLVAHNGLGYDFVVLDAACAQLGIAPPPELRLDTLELAHVVFPRVGEEIPANSDGTRPPVGRSLDVLGEALGVNDPAGRAHRALDDARTTARVMHALIERLGRPDPTRRLQSWLLALGGHPWGAFLSPPEEPPELADVIEEPAEWPIIAPAGRFDLEEAVAPLREDGSLMGTRRRSRPQQVAMAGEIAQAIANSSSLMIEAPTGTGKTLAYLVPALAWARASGECVVIATHSKVLQNQILTTIPELEPAFGEVRATLVKGRDNYIGLEALDDALDGVPTDPDDALALAIIAGWVAITPTGDWDDLRTWAIERHSAALPRYKALLRVDETDGMATTDLQRACFRRRAVTRMESADIAILNHAVLIRRRDWLDQPEENRVLVIDEAHNLEESATSALTESASSMELGILLDGVQARDRRSGFLRRFTDATGSSLRATPVAAVTSALRDARASLDLLSESLVAYVSDRAGARRATIEKYGTSYRIRPGLDTARPAYSGVWAASSQLATALRAMAAALDDLEVPSGLRRRYRRARLESEKSRLARRLREAARLVYEIPHCDTGESIDDVVDLVDLAIAAGRWHWTLRRVPVSVARGLSTIWGNARSTILTSATLSVSGNFSHLAARLGFTGVPRALPSPFADLAERHLMVLPDHLPTPRGGLLDEFTWAESDEIARLLAVSDGRALVLMTARSRLEKVRDHVRDTLEPLQLPVLAQGEAPSPALAEQMRHDERASLLALRSFWEGIDVPGSALSLLVIEKLPFDPPDDPIVLARMDEIERRGGDPFSEYLVPQAALRFVQGVGRLIRSETDVGATVVLDKRLRRATPYREQFLGSVPGPPTILRPRTPDEGYEAIATQVGRVFDDELRAVADSFKSADPWGDILPLSPEEARDVDAVRAKLEEVREKLGFAAWRPGQLEVMERFLTGEDVLAVMPTGSGKSITFQIPALVGPGLTLVISPLVALMRDQVESLKARGVTSVAGIYSGLSQSEQEEILAGARSGRYKLLYVSPERLWSGRFRTALESISVARVAVDEAHCISQWGHSLRPEYAAIPLALQAICDTAARPPLLAATATATPRVQREIVDLLGMHRGDPIVQSPDRPELHYYVEDCASIPDRDVRVVEILEGLAGSAVIVYVPRRDDATRLAATLRAANHAARAYHGGMAPEERLNVEELFRYGDIDVVVATKAFGLGIDKPDIATIVHLEMPASIEEYVQETGRAARGAVTGEGPAVGHCVLIRAPRDCAIHRAFVRSAAPGVDVVQAVWSVVSAADHTLLPVEELVTRVRLPDVDEEAVALALHYLIEDGAVVRHADVMWRGRVWLPPDIDAILLEIERHDRDLAESGRQVAGVIRRIGSEEYHATTWAPKFSLSPADLEQRLLELNRRDILGLAAWQFATSLERVAGAEPSWRSIDVKCRERTGTVSALSDAAKAFARQDGRCRRASLLEYLGLESPEQCGRCDVCDPSLPRPWQTGVLTSDQVRSALPSEAVVRAMLYDVGGRFSQRSITHALAGSNGGRYPISPHLKAHHLFGHLAALKPEGVKSVIETLVEHGQVEVVTVDRPGGNPYASWKLTDAGRAAA